MISLGGNIYFLAKLFATDGRSSSTSAAQMAGMSRRISHMMLSGGKACQRAEAGRRAMARSALLRSPGLRYVGTGAAARAGRVKLRVPVHGICGQRPARVLRRPDNHAQHTPSRTGVQNPVIMGHELCGKS